MYAQSQWTVLSCWLGLSFCSVAATSASDGPVTECTVVNVDADRCRIEVAAPAAPAVPGSRLLAATARQPLGWFEPLGAPPTEFGRAERLPLPSSPRELRAWLVRPDVVGMVVDRWPAEGILEASIDCIGPGARTVWLVAGSNHGVRSGQSWWLRLGGQPVARFDVRLVEPTVCFCSVVPLASEPRLTGGARVAMWPAPGQQRRGTARSAVAFVQTRGDAEVVWVPAPRQIVCPPELHLDLYRGKQYIGHAVVEQRDDRFWYARMLPFRDWRQPTTSAPSLPPPIAQDDLSRYREAADDDATPFVSLTGVRVGDDVVIRTQADIDRRRFSARVFEITTDGGLITAGETDRLVTGQTGTLYRNERALGSVVITRVQRGYAVVRLTAARDENGGAGRVERDRDLHLADEVRFGPPPRLPKMLGTIEQVADETLFAARLEPGASAPVLTPLAVQQSGNTVGVALLIATEGTSALGFVLGPSLTRGLEAGFELAYEPPSQGAQARP